MHLDGLKHMKKITALTAQADKVLGKRSTINAKNPVCCSSNFAPYKSKICSSI